MARDPVWMPRRLATAGVAIAVVALLAAMAILVRREPNPSVPEHEDRAAVAPAGVLGEHRIEEAVRAAVTEEATTSRSGELGAAIEDARAGDVARFVVRVHGVPPRLLPYLELVLRDIGASDGDFAGWHASWPQRTTDPGGCATFEAEAGRYRIGVRVGRGWRSLRAVAAGGYVHTAMDGAVIDVEPDEPLVAIVVREHGSPTGSSIRLDRGNVRGMAAGHVLRGELLSASTAIWFRTAGHGWHWCPAAALQRDGELAFVDVESATAGAHLRVLAAVPEEFYSALGIEAVPHDGGAPVRIGGNSSPFAADACAGSYSLRWTIQGTPGPVIDPRLCLAPGETREVIATVPALEAWTCRIVDPPQFDPPARFMVRLDEIWAFGCDVDGSAPVLLPAAPEPDAEVLLFSPAHKLDVPAQARVDAGTRTIEIHCAVRSDQVVRLRSTGLGTGSRQIALAPATGHMESPAWLGASVTMPLPDGRPRNGCVVEAIDRQRQVVRWFTARLGAAELLLEPQGRWATVRLERQVSRATILVEGHADLPAQPVGRLDEPGELRVFVADGTRAVHVDLAPGGRVTFAAECVEMTVR